MMLDWIRVSNYKELTQNQLKYIKEFVQNSRLTSNEICKKI